jgi:uncharacterized protein YceK
LLILLHAPLDTAATNRDATEFTDTEANLNLSFKIIGAICLVCSACGCGTFMNTVGFTKQPEYQIYGGVRMDVEEVVGGLNGTKNDDDAREMALFCLIDMPFSIFADTLTLPWVIYRQVSPPKKEASATKEPEKLSSQGSIDSVPFQTRWQIDP